ncbi:MAG: hypothetical protein B7Z73_10925, partial [Planctomycetia bacterium 21-64-5]
INVIKMTNVLSASPTFTSTNLAVNPYSQAVPELQPDGTAITTNTDSRIMNAAMRNGLIVAAHTVSDTTGDLDQVQWYEIDTTGGTPVLAQQGDVGGGSGNYYAYPAIDVNAAGDIGMTFIGSSGSQFMSTYIAGRASTDAPGTMQAPVLVKAGQANSPDTREGDMSGISVDGDGSFWADNEYATNSTTTYFTWGTDVAHFSIAPANNGTFANADPVGALGPQTQIFSGDLQPITLDPNLVFPGGLLDPGHRDIPLGEENHASGTTPGGAKVVYYSFPTIYGYATWENPTNPPPLYNQITAAEEQTVNEIFQLYSYYTGINAYEVPSGGKPIFVGDLRALDPTIPPNSAAGLGGPGGVGINGNIAWNPQGYGSSFMSVTMHEIGHALGLPHDDDGPPGTIMNGGAESLVTPTGNAPPPIYPGLADITNLLFGNEPNSDQIDLYKFSLDTTGTLSAETEAQRTGSTLDSLLTLYEEYQQIGLPAAGGGAVMAGQTFTITDNAQSPAKTYTFQFDLVDPTTGKPIIPIDPVTGKLADGNFGVTFSATSRPQDLAVSIVTAVEFAEKAGLTATATIGTGNVQLAGPISVDTTQASEFSVTAVRSIIARNDNYFGKDSFIGTSLSPGIYYVAVTSTGNNQFDPDVAGSGWGGQTYGNYQLRLGFQPSATVPGQPPYVPLTAPGQSLFVPLASTPSKLAGYSFTVTDDSASAAGQPALNTIAPAGAGGALAPNTYYYVVTAVMPDGYETVASNEQKQSTSPGDETLALSWTGVAGAARYNVYRGTTSGSETLLATVPNTLATFTDDGTIAPPAQNAITPAASGNLAAGTTYYYVVTAVDANGDQTIADT